LVSLFYSHLDLASKPFVVVAWPTSWNAALFVNYRTVPGMQSRFASVPGTEACSFSCRYNKGYTAVHEAGHYFGLYHTFTKYGACVAAQDDEVGDTPLQKSPGGPSFWQDSCPNDAGLDPIWSFLDYSDDRIMQQFSDGQVVRMRQSIAQYRPLLASNSLVLGGGGSRLYQGGRLNFLWHLLWWLERVWIAARSPFPRRY
jgi:hypothetical protein